MKSEQVKQKLYQMMEEIDYMDDDLSADVEEFVELEFDGMYQKELAGHNDKIRKIWFEFCYDENKQRYLEKFNISLDKR